MNMFCTRRGCGGQSGFRNSGLNKAQGEPLLWDISTPWSGATCSFHASHDSARAEKHTELFTFLSTGIFLKNRRFCTVTWETGGQENLDLVRQWCREGGLFCVGTQIWLSGCRPGHLGIRTWDLGFSRTSFKSLLSYFIAVQSPLASELILYSGNGK